MKSSIMVLAVVAVLAAPALAVSHSAATAPPQNVMYGHIKTMARKGNHYEIKFDPAWWLTGVAAERAKLEDTGSSDVPNDYYIVEAGHRLLTLVVLPNARVTVLTDGPKRTRISAAELAHVVDGTSNRRLSERKAGFWIRIGPKYPNPAVTLDQQYQP
jgi:hypothetical protein